MRADTPHTPAAENRELVLTRLIDVPRHQLFRCWTEPALIVVQHNT